MPEPPGIDRQALGELLTLAGLDGSFGTISAEYVGRFSNDVWRLSLDNGVRLVAKRAWRAVRAEDEPDAERSFYRHCAASQGATRFDLPIPRFIGEIGDLLILEFLELSPFDFSRSVGQDHAVRAMNALADWHAAWWRRAPRVEWLPDYGDPELRMAIQNNYDSAWRAHRATLLAGVPQFAELGDALVGRLADTLAPMAQPATLIHGDAHAENLPMVGKRVVLLDWEEPRIANPGYDLAVFTSMSYRTSERADWERALVMRHAERLQRAGCDWPDPWRDYRLGLLRRAARIVEIARLGFGSLPWVFRRSASAALAHEAQELIL